MTFGNVILMCLLQRIRENNNSFVVHWLAAHVSICLNETINLGKCIPVFRSVEKKGFMSS